MDQGSASLARRDSTCGLLTSRASGDTVMFVGGLMKVGAVFQTPVNKVDFYHMDRTRWTSESVSAVSH